MRRILDNILLFAFVLLPLTVRAQSPAPLTPPPLRREFRGVWVATVGNIDWPSRPGLPSEVQKQELITILDRCVSLGLNAVIFQVRPACDALYRSDLEPWSEYLSGQMGQPPSPFYDPLEFAVVEAHRRGLELHAWVNPYRARHVTRRGEVAPTHVTRTKPELARTYGKYIWLDPGDPRTAEHSLAVIMDIVNRYDIDGIHFDDYFYPYKERDSQNKIIDFPDDETYARYQAGGGKLSRADWRRDNVNRFVEALYTNVKKAKPWVKVGISPFGIWRPGNPPMVRGMDQYNEIYADAKLWLNKGWLDYISPQLYWKTDAPQQPFEPLLAWWVSQNTQKRHVWPGLIPSSVGTKGWSADEIAKQVTLTRRNPGSTGNVLFSMKPLLTNPGNLVETLRPLYEEPAFIPPSPWLDNSRPAKPQAVVDRTTTPGVTLVTWKPGSKDFPRQWALYALYENGWTVRALPAGATKLPVRNDASPRPIVVAIAAIDRVNNESEPAIVDLASGSAAE
ncbi:MAG: family 10 glycosylhydrolase [Candidatus Sumerlaeaceae bacterium]|nr:family 10 glycosylhydrolase [Candidatus Sumerlaeaceae bacterium]